MRLAISGDVNLNPGPVLSRVWKTHLAEPTRKNHVSCLSLNARSIVNKRVELRSRLSSTTFELVAVTESWVDSSLSSAEIFPSTYYVHRKDRSRNGGGVLLACSHEISSIRRSEIETDCEIMWCEIIISNPYSRIMVGVFYRPPATAPVLLFDLSVNEGLGNSDHNSIEFNLRLKILRPNQSPRIVYNFGAANWNNLRDDFSNIP